MKGRIFNSAQYKAWQEGIITSRVSPANTSKECARCHGLIARYDAPEGYTPGTPLAFCPLCGMKGNADRNASLVIGQRLLARSHVSPTQEKPPTPLLRAAERDEQSSGLISSQDANSTDGPSAHRARRHGTGKGHGTAHEGGAGMAAHARSLPPPLRLLHEERLCLISRANDYRGGEEAAVQRGRAERHYAKEASIVDF